MNQIAQIIEAYDSQGHHRTGTEGDNLNAEWLSEQILEAKQEPKSVSFPHLRIDPISSELRVNSHTIEGLPLFDCAFTDADGVRGKLGTMESPAAITVGPQPANLASEGTIQFLEARRQTGYNGLVAIGVGESPGIAPQNAEAFLDPFGPPVLQVSCEHAASLQEAAASGEEACLIAEVERTPVEISNVEVHIKGKDSSLPLVVVITPRSGWWQCASERGGGIACWLEMIRALSESSPIRDVRFLASTGHELSHLGLKHFLKTNENLVQDAHAWIHLGANFAANPSAVRLQVSDDSLDQLASSAMEEENVSPASRTPIGTRPGGEARGIYDGDGRYISLLGSSTRFHHPDDRWPKAVDVDKTSRLVTAFVRILRKLSGK